MSNNKSWLCTSNFYGPNSIFGVRYFAHSGYCLNGYDINKDFDLYDNTSRAIADNIMNNIPIANCVKSFKNSIGDWNCIDKLLKREFSVVCKKVIDLFNDAICYICRASESDFRRRVFETCGIILNSEVVTIKDNEGNMHKLFIMGKDTKLVYIQHGNHIHILRYKQLLML